MKKFLSLVLALVMTMSLVTISAGAKDFTDADKVTYTEAVDVLSAVKVIDGYTDGAFKPTTQLNRGQAAKILCNMILGPTTASALKADAAPFKDVAADNTFAAYIAYCAKEGIIDGYTDGTFRPTAPLTGYAFMKLLLGSLGYDKDVEGYNGANWSINVAKRALNLGLDDGLVDDFDGTKIVTREEACLFALNTLAADMVEYDAKTNISVGGAEVVIAGSKAKEVANNARVETIFEDDTMQFAEKYFTNLKLNNAARDDFYRPSNQWKNKAETIGTYSQTPDLTYTKGVKNGAIYSDLGLGSTIAAADVKIYVDGDSVANTKNLVKGGTSTMGKSANGVVTEVFYNDKADTVELIQINTYVGTVAKSVKATDAKDAYIVVTPDGDAKPDGVGGSGLEFETDEVFEDDAVVLYTYSQIADAVEAVAVAESVEGTVTEAQNDKVDLDEAKSVTIDGETYKAAAKFAGEDIGSVTVKSDYKVYLDEYGYMIMIEEVENLSSDYALVIDLRGANNFDSNRAKLLFGDGTMKVVDTVKDYTKPTSKVSQWDIVSYKAEDGVYTLKAVNAANQYSASLQQAGEFELVNNKAGIKLDDDVRGATTLNANSKSTFVVYDLYDDEIDAYTGVKTVPTIKTTNAVNADVYAYCKNGTMTTIMFVLAENDSIIEDENNKILYVAQKSASNLIHDNDGDYFKYNAVVNGEITTVKVADDATVADPSALVGMYKSYSTNSKGIITKLNALTGYTTGENKEYLTGTGISKTSADYTVTLGTKAGPNATITVDDDAKIYYVDKDGKISVSSYSAIAVDDNDKVFAYVDEWLVKTLFIEEVADTVADTGAAAASNGITAAVTDVRTNGRHTIQFTYERPSYVPDTASALVKYTVLEDGYAVYSNAVGVTVTGTRTTKVETTNLVDSEAEISIRIDSVTPSAVKVLYQDKNKNDITDMLVATGADKYTETLATSGANTLQFKLDTRDTATGKFKYSITGVNAPVAATTTALAANAKHSFTKSAVGNDYVVVTIEMLSELAEIYTVDASATSTATQLNALTGVTYAGTLGTTTLKVETAKANVEAGGDVALTATIGAASSTVGLKVTLTNGTVFFFANDGSQTTDTVILRNVNAPVELKIASVEDVAAPTKAVIASAVLKDVDANGVMSTADQIVLTFTEAVTAAPKLTKVGNVEVDDSTKTLSADGKTATYTVKTVNASADTLKIATGDLVLTNGMKTTADIVIATPATAGMQTITALTIS